ncbi:MAG: glycoside hydrolase family 15 protein [Thermoleophilaceae bacterium]|nr:glycoside hydrolase family 15 protein [Thermoleophilaceae bacterium]
MALASRNGFAPIADYAFLSDCETCALVAPGGQVEWLCLPRPDSPSVFGSLLDRTAGVFGLLPDGTTVPTQRRYLAGSMVLETTWRTPTGWLVVHDSLVVAAWDGAERSDRHRRPPGDFVARQVLLRVATCIDGEAVAILDCLPQFDYGRRPGAWSYDGDGYGRARVECDALEQDLVLTTNARLGFIGPRAYARAHLREGDGLFAALSWGGPGPESLKEAYEQSNATAKHWRGWLKQGNFPDHPWRSYLERSALTLKGLSHAPTGAVLAAATTSLPETPGGERNWDYRYTWVRDSAFLLWGLFSLGFDWEAYEFFSFIAETVGTDELQIMYGIGGEKDLTEHTLDHLSGYDGARPVRTGNGAYRHRQHDVWGMLLDSFALHTRRNAMSRQVPNATWEVISRHVEDAITHWTEPDRGIWEVRGAPKHFTASKVMCWVALDRGLQMAEARGDRERAERWRGVAAEIQADVCERGIDDRGVFVQHYETDALDASLLLIPLMGFLPPDDERVRATVLAIADELTKDGLVLRYRVGHTDDGLEGEEGTFTICSFWLVSALARIGETERARALCERLLSFASPLELYAEEIDAASGRHLGNFPQAFTHLSLVNAVMELIAAER